MSGERDPAVFLDDMVGAAEHLVATTSGVSDLDLLSEAGILRGDMLHHLVVLGEAAKHVPGDVRAMRPGIQWSTMAGMRDKIVHYYFGLDDRMILQAVRVEVPRDLPLMRTLLEQIDEGRGS